MAVATPAQSVEVGLELERLWSQIGKGDLDLAARTALLMFETLEEPGAQAEVHAAVAVILQRVGRITEARDRFLLAASLVRSDPKTQASYLANAAGCRFLAGELVAAADDAHRARKLGERHGNRFALCEALNTLASLAMSEGRPTDALRLTRQAVSLQDVETESTGDRPMAHLYQGMALIELDRFAAAEEAFSEGLRRAKRSGADAQFTWYHALRGLGRFLSGRWDDALTDARQSMAEADQTGTRIALPYGRAVIAMVHANRADHAVARQALSPGSGEVAMLSLPGGDWISLARASSADNLSEAYDAVLDAWLHSKRSYLLSWRSALPSLVQCALNRGERDVAAAVTEAAQAGAERAGGVASASAAALHCTALVGQDPDAAKACMNEYRRSGRPFALGRACLQMAVVLERAGDRRAALAAAREAAEVFSVLRAIPWVARAGRVLQRLAPTAPAPDVPAEWETLTATERQVAHLVARGLTNPEIAGQLVVSPRTVQTHTSHIYAKLSVTSRAQLAGLLRHQRTE